MPKPDYSLYCNILRRNRWIAKEVHLPSSIVVGDICPGHALRPFGDDSKKRGFSLAIWNADQFGSSIGTNYW